MDSFKLYFVITLCIIFFMIGSVGNIISIKIFLNKEFISQPITVYLIASAIINLVSLLYLPVMVLPEIWVFSNLACQIFGGFMVLLVEIQSWIYVFCSVDRAITTLFSHGCFFKNKFFFQIGMMVLCSFILLLSIFPNIYFYQAIKISNQTVCEFTQGPEYPWNFIYSRIQFILFRVVVPFIVTIVASILTIHKLCVSKRRVQANNAHNFKREYQFAKSLIVMDLLFIIFRLPTAINAALTEDTLFIYDFLYSIFGLLGALHNVFLFLIFIVFNKIYRDLFLKIFTNHERNSAGPTPQNQIIMMNVRRSHYEV